MLGVPNRLLKTEVVGEGHAAGVGIPCDGSPQKTARIVTPNVIKTICNDLAFVATWIYLYNVGVQDYKTGITAYKWRSLHVL